VPVAYSLFEGAKVRLGMVKTKPGVIDTAGHAILDNPDA
jgi:hypothetical protein